MRGPAQSTIDLAVRLAHSSACDMGSPVYAGTVRGARVYANWQIDPTAGPKIPGRFHGPYTLRGVLLFPRSGELGWAIEPTSGSSGRVCERLDPVTVYES